MLRDERLQEIEQRLGRATPGPWEYIGQGWIAHPGTTFDAAGAPDQGMIPCTDADADLITHAPEDLAALLAELRATTADLAVAVEVARERGEETERLRRRLGMTRDNAADDLAELRDENERLTAVAAAARSVDVLLPSPSNIDVKHRDLLTSAMVRLGAALDALDAGGEQS